MKIEIAGMIGVGKSTLAAKISKYLNLPLVKENIEDNPYLEDYYKDNKKYAMQLAIYFLKERFLQNLKYNRYVKDRSIYEDMDIFTQNSFDCGFISSRDYTLYKELYNAMVYNKPYQHCNLVIYLDASFDTIMKRIKSRNRKYETATNEEYFLNLYEKYNNWANNFNTTKIVKINTDNLNEDELFEYVKNIYFKNVLVRSTKI